MSATSQPITGPRSTTRPPLTGKQRAGFVLAILLFLANLPSVLVPTPDGEVGPPLGILVLGTVLAGVGLVATVLAWRGSALAKRIAAGALVVLALTSLPAFFVDVPLVVKVLVGVSTLLTVLAIALMFSGRRSGAGV